tara:strand:- start:204 stop:1466 length:1263 start_codon:yes stop_codon:yes gene_type:complete
MAIVQGRTRAQLRQSVGYNLGAVYVSSASGNGSTTTIVDNTLIGADDNHNGKWVIFNDASGNSGQTTRVSDYTSSNTTLALSPAVDASSATSDTYEMWDDIYSPARINEFINQAITDATGHAYDPVEKLDLHTDGKSLRFDIPSGLSMIQDIYYRDKVDFTRLHACASVFDESVDSDFTVALDTKDKKQGTQSCKFTIAAGASAGDLATDSITSKDISGYDYVEFWVKSTVATSAGNLKVHLDDTANCASPVESISIPALSADTWTFVRDKIDNPELCSAIISVGLEFDSDLGACTVWLDDISAVKNDSAQWVKMPRNLWRIDKEAKDIVLDDYAHGVARYNLLKLVGGDKPALLTSDSDTSEIDEQYIIARATALAFASASGGPQTDPDNKNNMAGFWMGLSSSARRAFPLLTNVRLVE